MSFTDVFKKIFGTKADRDMKAIRPTLDKVLEAYKKQKLFHRQSVPFHKTYRQVKNIGKRKFGI